MIELLSIEQLRALAEAPRAAASPLIEGQPLLLIDTRSAAPSDESQPWSWLRALPAPVIAVGGPASPLSCACDMHVGTMEAASGLARAIMRTPLAAAVLVQTLRLTEHLDVESGLVVESLAYASLQNGAEFRRWQTGFQPLPTPPTDGGPAVLVERRDEVLQLRLNRPGIRNAMTVEMRDALLEALELAVVDQSITTLEISAHGRCFSTGGELREFGTAPDPATAHAIRGLALPGRLLQRLAARSTARVHGACIGSGIEFPAFAGRVVAQADAWFQLPELRYGLIPGAGGCVSIARRIGRQRTAWLALSGERINAQTALDWGLVDAVEA